MVPQTQWKDHFFIMIPLSQWKDHFFVKVMIPLTQWKQPRPYKKSDLSTASAAVQCHKRILFAAMCSGAATSNVMYAGFG